MPNSAFTPAGIVFDSSNAQPLGVAAPGTSVIAARVDHVHLLPTAIQNNATNLSGVLAATGQANWTTADNNGRNTSGTLALSGQQAWQAADNNGRNTSGNLGTTGSNLNAYISGVSGLGILQNYQSGSNYTLTLNDANRFIYHHYGDTSARIWTIPAWTGVNWPIGTPVTFVNDSGAGSITIQVTTPDVMMLAGAGTIGTRTLTAYGIATALNIASGRWLINGTNLT